MSTKNLIQTTKTVAVYNSANNSLVEIEIPETVTTRNQLEKYLDQNNIVHANTTMIIGETTTGLVSPDSALPEGNFTLMLSPKKVKSGVHGFKNASFSEMRNFIKEEISKNAEKVKQHFGNYTQLSTEALRSKIATYFPSKIKVNVLVKKSAPIKKAIVSKKNSLKQSLQKKLEKIDVVLCKK